LTRNVLGRPSTGPFALLSRLNTTTTIVFCVISKQFQSITPARCAIAEIKTGSLADVDVRGNVPHPGAISPSADTAPGEVVPAADVVPATDVGPLGSLTPELFDAVVRRVSNSFLSFALSTYSRRQATPADDYIASSG
jgi:hypothetical protein